MLANSRLLISLSLFLAAAPALAAQETATWYIGTYTNDILVWDEASEEVVDRITIRNLVPNRMQLSADMSRIYVGEASAQSMEIVDVASGEVVDEFTLSHDSVSVRIEGFAPHPSDERIVLSVKRYTRHVDRFTVEGPFLLEYDLVDKVVTDTVPWPSGARRERARFQYSPSGETLYFFSSDIIAVDADTHEVVDRWEISEPIAPGLGRAGFDVTPGTYDEEGVVTSIFTMTDPVQNRRLMGIARVDLEEKDLDFYTLGEQQPVGQFVVAPGGERGYALLEAIGRYEFWEFDLVNERVLRREPFEGRPRMGLRVSADGEKLYVFIAGATIDVYDVDTFDLLRTVTFDEDMRPSVVIPGPAPGR